MPSQLPLNLMICAGVLQCPCNCWLRSRFDVVLRQEYFCSVKNTSVVSNAHLYAHQQAIYVVSNTQGPSMCLRPTLLCPADHVSDTNAAECIQ